MSISVVLTPPQSSANVSPHEYVPVHGSLSKPHTHETGNIIATSDSAAELRKGNIKRLVYCLIIQTALCYIEQV